MATQAPDIHEELVASTPEELREQALRRLHKRREFTAHAAAYVVVNTVVWAIWLVISINSHSWFPWPALITLGWGIGLVMNAWDVYLRQPITEEEVEREMRRLGGSSGQAP